MPVSLEKTATSGKHEKSRELLASPEVQEDIDEIQAIDDAIAERLKIDNPEKETDTYLVEKAELSEATIDDIESALIAGALEATGQRTSEGDNPIKVLEFDGYGMQITDVIKELHEAHATLPDGEQAAVVLAEEINKLSAATGSLEPSWKERSVAAEDVERGMAHASYGLEGASIGEIGYQDGYKVDKVPIALGIDGQQNVYREVKDMSDEERRLFGIHGNETTDFNKLDANTKQALLTDRLALIEYESRSEGSRKRAIEKNIARIEKGIVLEQGDYIHGLGVNDLKAVLNTGLVAGEAIGMKDAQKPKSDRYPYNLDLYNADILGANNNGHLIMENTGGYGDIIAVVDRSQAIDSGNEVDSGSEGHELIFGGVPSTDIRSIHVRTGMAHNHNQTNVLAETLRTIYDEGFYIPVYDGDGVLVLTYDEYTRRREADLGVEDIIESRPVSLVETAPISAVSEPPVVM